MNLGNTIDMNGDMKFNQRYFSSTRLTRSDQFDRQINVAGMCSEKQKKLSNASILIFGVGGLGVASATYLATAGIGKLTLVDHDVIEGSNLHRQFMYRQSDVGQLKVKVAQQFIRDRSSTTEVVTISSKLTGQELYDACAVHDIILDCTDDLHFSFELNDWALMLNKPVIFANATGLDGQLFFSHGQESPCLRCLWPEEPASTGDRNRNGVFGPVAGTIGCLQALEAIKYLTQFAAPLSEKMLHIDLGTLEQTTLEVKKSHACTHTLSHYDVLRRHKKNPYVLREYNPEEFNIIDIGELSESILTLPSNINFEKVPISHLLNKPKQFITSDKKTLLVCALGQRSFFAAIHLQKQGFSNVFALRQG